MCYMNERSYGGANAAGFGYLLVCFGNHTVTPGLTTSDVPSQKTRDLV